MSRKKRSKPTNFQMAAANAAARMALRSMCWVTVQVPDTDQEKTAYVNFRTMQVLPWGNQAAQVREAMNMTAYDWRMWWVICLDTWDGLRYKISELGEEETRRRNLRDLLQEASREGQKITEEQRLDMIQGRGAIMTTSDHPLSNEQLLDIYLMTAEHGTPVDQIMRQAPQSA